jgi:hypothetical protein
MEKYRDYSETVRRFPVPGLFLYHREHMSRFQNQPGFESGSIYEK